FDLASLGDKPDATVEYAVALYNGDVVAKNQQAAYTLFNRAALKNNPIAQDRLAHILASGIGAPADGVAAAKWWLISKARGETDLVLDDFGNKLTPARREKAENQTNKWLEARNKPTLP